MEKTRRKQKTVRDQEDALLAKRLRPLTRLLLNITDDLDWGEKYDVAPMHVNRKDMMLRYLQGLCYLIFPKKLTQKALRQHFRGERTLYFTGSRGDLSLVYIDPDCHNSGSKEGAFEFGETCGAAVPAAQDIVDQGCRRDACTTKFAESPKNEVQPARIAVRPDTPSAGRNVQPRGGGGILGRKEGLRSYG